MKTRLTRSMTNKKIAGVAGGIAEAFGWDATLVRLGFVALTLFHGGGVLLYLLLLLVMPSVGASSVAERAMAGVQQMGSGFEANDRNRTLGIVLVAFGGLLLASVLHLQGPVLALMILGAGYYLLRQR